MIGQLITSRCNDLSLSAQLHRINCFHTHECAALMSFELPPPTAAPPTAATADPRVICLVTH